ncbi:MAG: CCA tRNA nucleotidyltransferase [Hyphomicrobiales bacterium]|nr:CCA tRNA nucleotidyltransferase [Hyphomicrobiales bacterium]
MNFAQARTLLADARVARVLAVLNGDGEETRIVGGAVRNALFGVPVEDVDLATTATPDVVTRRAKAAHIRVLPTGVEHGTVALLLDGKAFETTTLREDVETDGRRAVVRFGRDFAADAQRRDFTVNSLSLSQDGVVHDPLRAIDDLIARRIRFIGDPRQRIAEDYLRILRFFRFSAAYGEGPLDRAGLDAASQLRAGLAFLSRERIGAETLKMLSAPRAPDVCAQISESGVAAFLFPGMVFPARLKNLVRADAQADVLLRLAAFAVLTRENAENLQPALRLSNAQTRRLVEAAVALEHLHDAEPPSGARLAELRFGFPGAADALALAGAERGETGGDSQWTRARAIIADMETPRLPASGEDFRRRGLSEGRAIGRALKALQARWIRAGFPQDPAVVAQLIEDVVAEAEARRD